MYCLQQQKMYCALMLPYLTTVHKSAQNWNRWPKRDTVCLLKEVKRQLDKFCSVVGLFFFLSNSIFSILCVTSCRTVAPM